MNADLEYVNIETWNLFRSRFKSEKTEASYWSDIREFCLFAEKAFTKAEAVDVKRYYDHLSQKIREGKLSPRTMTKKFRELHSYAAFCAETDLFYPYLKGMVKEAETALCVPVEDMDALLKAAAEDSMAYAILTLMYRAGLSSTEIMQIRGEEDFICYDEGIYLQVQGRRELCYIPEDAWTILRGYMDQREKYETLFFNRSGRPLNGMYISRMMKRYCAKAGIKGYSAQAVRNSCAFNLFAYGASSAQTAEQMGRTEQQIRRYKGAGYRKNLKRHVSDLVKMRIESP